MEILWKTLLQLIFLINNFLTLFLFTSGSPFLPLKKLGPSLKGNPACSKLILILRLFFVAPVALRISDECFLRLFPG